MKAAYLNLRILVLLSFFALSYSVRSQQFSAGINTETPNPNAVLHLVAPNGDQGLIIPTLTTAQRTAMALTAAENGLLVFDSTDGLFYYYLNGWIALTTAGSETDPTVPATIKDGIDWTELTGIPGVFADGTDDVIDPDADVTNELITGGALAGNILTITEAGVDHNIDLSAFASAPQDLQFAGSILSITGDPTPTSVDFNLWDQNAADDLTTANVGTAANQIVQLDGAGALPAVDGSNLTGIITTVTSDGTTITGDGVGTPLAVNAGTGANQIVQLDGLGALPAIDGSNLTGVTSTVSVDGSTITGDGSITPLAVGSISSANIAAGGALTGQVLEFDGASWVPAADDGLTVVTTDISLVGDGTVGTPLSLNRVNPAIIAAGGATLGQILEFNGTNWVPGTDDVGMLAATYDPNTVAGDAFNFGTHASTTAAVAGNVLTFNGTTWDAAAPTGLTLPYSQTLLNVADLFALTNTGTGGAGNFAVNNLVNAGNALSASTNGTGSALNVSHAGTGVGVGVNVAMTSATGTGPALNINHAGLGPGIEILTTTGPPLFISGGAAGDVLTSDGLGNITLQPGGLTLPYTQTVTNAGDLFHLINDGTGGAGAFQILNAANAATALSANTNGSGSVILASHTGASGPGINVSITGAANPSAGLLINHAGTGPGIEVTTASGPNITLNGATPFFIPTGATLGHVLTSDASGNAAWSPPLTLPYANSVADAGPLFSISNSGTGPAAFFENTSGSSAIAVNGILSLNGNIEMQSGAPRAIGILPGSSDNLTVIAGSSNGTDGNTGGNLILRGGDGGAPTGNGGNIELIPGTSSVSGGILAGGVTRFRNPATGILGGGTIELENDGGGNVLAIRAHELSDAYGIIFPQSQGVGSLTNDGFGNLSWSSGGGAFSSDANQNLIAISAAAPTGTDNFIAGNAAGSLGAGNNNIAIGEGAGGALAGGSDNFFMGFDVGGPNMINGNSNILFGSGGRNSDDSNNNVGIGQNVIMGGGSATALGAFSSATGANSLALGTGANVTLPNVGVIGDPTNPIDIGIGTNNPNARVQALVSGATTLDVMNLTNDGDGRNLVIDVSNLANTAPAVLLAQNGLGVGIDARVTNSSSTSTVMTVQQQGDAPVAFFNQGNAGSTAPVINLSKVGGGPDIQMSGVGVAFNIPGATAGYVLTSNAAGDVTLQPSASGGFALDANNNLLGNTAPAAISTGSDNFLAGQNAGFSLTTGLNNVAIGPNAGANISSGQGNILIGQDAGGSLLSTGTGNVIIGQGASTIDNASPHVIIGQGASADGVLAIAIGPSSSATGDGSIAIGAGVNVTTNDVAVIGNPASIFGVGIGTSTPAAKLHVERAVGSGGNVITGSNLGASGSAGQFVINNTTSSSPAVYASTTGSGNALLVDHVSATSGDALAVNHSATTGRGIVVDMNAVGGEGLFIGGTQPGVNSISVDGGIQLSTNFTTISNPTAFDVSLGPIPITHRVLKLIGNANFDTIEISGARDGQELILVCEAGATPQADAGATLRLDNGSSLAMSAGSTLHLIFIETLNQWLEIGRSR